MKQKKRGMVCIAALMFALLVGGCGDKREKADTTTALRGNETTTVSQEGSSQSESEFDFSQVYDNIELNGKKIPFPFTLNDLGEEYDFKYTINEIDDGFYGSQLAHNGEVLGSIYMYGESEKSINRDSQVVRIEIYANRKQEFSIKGINCESNIQDVNKAFENLPVRYNEQNIMYGYRASDNHGKVFDLYIDNEKIEIITIRKEIK